MYIHNTGVLAYDLPLGTKQVRYQGFGRIHEHGFASVPLIHKGLIKLRGLNQVGNNMHLIFGLQRKKITLTELDKEATLDALSLYVDLDQTQENLVIYFREYPVSDVADLNEIFRSYEIPGTVNNVGGFVVYDQKPRASGVIKRLDEAVHNRNIRYVISYLWGLFLVYGATRDDAHLTIHDATVKLPLIGSAVDILPLFYRLQVMLAGMNIGIRLLEHGGQLEIIIRDQEIIEIFASLLQTIDVKYTAHTKDLGYTNTIIERLEGVDLFDEQGNAISAEGLLWKITR